MKKAILLKATQMLEEQKRQITSKLLQSSASDIDIDGDDTDIIQAKILALATAKLALRDRESLVKIDNALKKIIDGSFGDCEECGDEISEKRIMFNPSFITCIVCAERLEMMARRK